jgi:DNA-binding LacI/PurR family transcriptional regulator
MGLHVPNDVSVIGYDDSMFMACTDPPLTTVRQPIGDMAQTAVALLVTQIDGGDVAKDEYLFDTELVVRASTQPPMSRRIGT